MNINTFELEIEERVLDRGYEYWQSGAVQKIVHSSENNITAVVMGSEPYHVSIALDKKGDITHSCTCPYDYGPICKHVVALLYELEERQINNSEPGEQGGGGDSGTGGWRWSGESDIDVEGEARDDLSRLEEILGNLEAKELRALILEYVRQDPSWGNNLLGRYSESDEESYYHYCTMLEEQLDSYRGRHGYIDYHQASMAGEEASDMVDRARALIGDGEFDQAIPMLHAVCTVMAEGIEDADDSDGSIGGAIEDAIHCFQEMAVDPDLPDAIRIRLISLLTDQELLSTLSAYSWDSNLLRILPHLVETAEEEKQVLSLLEDQYGAAADGSVDEGVRQGSWNRSYKAEEAARITLALFQLRRSPAENEAFIRAHAYMPSFRKLVLQQHFERGEYQELYREAEEGVIQDAGLPGLVREWTGWILKGAQASGDTDRVRESAWKLMANGGSETTDLLDILKSTISAENWPKLRDTLFEDLSGHDRFHPRLIPLYIHEGLFDRLWAAVKARPDIEKCIRYGQYLLPQYHEEMAELAEGLVLKQLSYASSRPVYAEAAQLLKILRVHGAKRQAESIAYQLLRLYPNRPAMRDELRKGGF